MSISDKYSGFYKCLGYMESTMRRMQLKFGYFMMPVHLVQYRGAVENFNSRKLFMPTNSGTVFLLLKITLCVALYKSRKTSKLISVGIPLFNILLILSYHFYRFQVCYAVTSKLTKAQKLYLNRVCLFVPGILAYLRII